MTPEMENAFRSVARKCLSEIRKSVSGVPASKHDSIITPILDKHVKQLANFPLYKFPHKSWLGHYIRQLQKE